MRIPMRTSKIGSLCVIDALASEQTQAQAAYASRNAELAKTHTDRIRELMSGLGQIRVNNYWPSREVRWR